MIKCKAYDVLYYINELEQENETLKQTHDYDLKMIDEVKSSSAKVLQENRQLKEKYRVRSKAYNAILLENANLEEQLKNEKKIKIEHWKPTPDDLLEMLNQELLNQLKQRDEVIDEAINKCELEIRASSYQYEKNHKQQELCYKVAHERIMEILNNKGDNK